MHTKPEAISNLPNYWKYYLFHPSHVSLTNLLNKKYLYKEQCFISQFWSKFVVQYEGQYGTRLGELENMESDKHMIKDVIESSSESFR